MTTYTAKTNFVFFPRIQQAAYHPLSFCVVNGRFNPQKPRKPRKPMKPKMCCFFVSVLSAGLIRGIRETKIGLFDRRDVN